MLFCPSICTEQLGFQWTDFHETLYLGIFPNSVEKIQDPLKSDENNGHFAWRPIYIFGHNSPKASYNENCFRWNKTHFILYFFFENRTVFYIMLKNIAKPDRPQMAKWRIRFECWIPKATNTHLDYAILIVLPLHQWVYERSSSLPKLPAILYTTKWMPSLEPLSYVLNGYHGFCQG